MSTSIQVFERRKVVWEKYSKGFSIYKIADELGTSSSLVWDDIRVMRQEWGLKIRDLDEQKELELTRIDSLEMEYWSAWLRSQDNKVVVTEESPISAPSRVAPGPQPGVGKMITQTTGQVGDPRFLDGALKCIERRCRLLGLDAPTKVLSIQIRWDLLTPEQVDRLSNGEEYSRVLDPSQYFLGSPQNPR